MSTVVGSYVVYEMNNQYLSSSAEQECRAVVQSNETLIRVYEDASPTGSHSKSSAWDAGTDAPLLLLSTL